MSDWGKEIERYLPKDQSEEKAKAYFLSKTGQARDAMLYREAPVHITVSALIVSPDFSKTLMVFHNIYRSFSWTGGHVDGETDFLEKSRTEAIEETGASVLYPLTKACLSLDLLPVAAHKRRGQAVEAHSHLNLTYAFIAPQAQSLRPKPDENSDVAFLEIGQLETVCKEPHMVPIYQKILSRMRSIRDEKQATFAKLPAALVEWYQHAARALPWRRDREPYHVWLSEIMLQQTRVEAVKGYYARFLQELPTIRDLALVDEDKLLKLWEGLGYYNRARNLKKAANQILERYGGAFPKTYAEISGLSGIGPYTAGAIASICFEAPKPAVDGNVLRVISRITECYAPSDHPKVKDWITESLAAVYPAGHCGDFTQSLMELGATVCLPNGAPLCAQCPAETFCLARRHYSIDDLPVKSPKKARRVEDKTVFLFTCQASLALKKRGDTGVLAGLWELPNVSGTLNAQAALKQAEDWGVKPTALLRKTKKSHIFTHIEWHMTGYYIACDHKSDAFFWASQTDLAEAYALPTAFKQFL